MIEKQKLNFSYWLKSFETASMNQLTNPNSQRMSKLGHKCAFLIRVDNSIIIFKIKSNLSYGDCCISTSFRVFGILGFDSSSLFLVMIKHVIFISPLIPIVIIQKNKQG